MNRHTTAENMTELEQSSQNTAPADTSIAPNASELEDFTNGGEHSALDDFDETAADAQETAQKESAQTSAKPTGVFTLEQTDEEKEADKKLRAESMKIMASVGNFGIFLILAVLFSYFIGNALDSFFGTKPVFTVFWILCGIAASIRELVSNIKKAMKLAEDSSPENKTDADSDIKNA